MSESVMQEEMHSRQNETTEQATADIAWIATVVVARIEEALLKNQIIWPEHMKDTDVSNVNAILAQLYTNKVFTYSFGSYTVVYESTLKGGLVLEHAEGVVSQPWYENSIVAVWQQQNGKALAWYTV